MLGELSALAAALTIAFSAIISRSLAVLINARPLQTIRAWFGAIFVLLMLAIFGRTGELTQIPLRLIGFMGASALVGVAIGDTFYMRTLRMVEVSRSFPTVRGTQIVATMLIASLLFDEKVSWATGVGAFMILGGVYLAAFAKRTGPGDGPSVSVPITKWVFTAMLAGLCWTVSFSFMKLVLMEVDALVAQAIRLPLAALLLTTLSLQTGQGKQLRIFAYKRKTIIFLVLSGILSYGMGVIFELYAISFAGMAKAAILTSWTPLFLLFLSAIFLKERITLRLLVGVLLCSGGTVVLMVL